MEMVTIRAYRKATDPDEQPFATVEVEADKAAMEEAVHELLRMGAKAVDFQASISVLDKITVG